MNRDLLRLALGLLALSILASACSSAPKQPEHEATEPTPTPSAAPKAQTPEEFKANVKAVMTQNAEQFKACYQKGVVEENRSIEGKILLRFAVTESGAVEKARIASSSVQSGVVENCALEVVQGLKFDAPASRQEVAYPLRFSIK